MPRPTAPVPTAPRPTAPRPTATSLLARRTVRAAAALVVATGLVAGCTQMTDVERAQKAVDEQTEALAKAQAEAESSRVAFCNSAGGYISALDRYGKIFTEETATVGDVRTLGDDLQRPGEAVEASASAAVDAHQAVIDAEAELATAQAELAAAQADTTAAPTSAGPAPTETPSTTTTTLLPAATVDRVRTGTAELDAAIAGVTDETPVAEAGEQVNAAAFALEVAWFRVVADAGCLTDEQLAEATAAVTGYTAAVQSAMQILGYLDGEVDGIYGPSTLAAVQSFQTAQGLPATGYVDAATSAATEAQLTVMGESAAVQATATAAAVQSMLQLAGFWSGPIDGQWTEELTDALSSLQVTLSVPATGVVDTATLEALRRAIADATPPATPTPDPPATTAPTAPTTTTAPTSTPGSAVPTTERRNAR